MMIVGWTQVRENYAADGEPHWLKNKGGHEYVLARLTATRAAELGQAGLQALVDERLPHVEVQLAADQLYCGAYSEHLIQWELLEDDWVSENQKNWDDYPEMRMPWEKERPQHDDRTPETDAARAAAKAAWEAKWAARQQEQTA